MCASRGHNREDGVTLVAGEIRKRPAPIPRLAHVDAVRSVLHQQPIQGAIGEHPRRAVALTAIAGGGEVARVARACEVALGVGALRVGTAGAGTICD